MSSNCLKVKRNFSDLDDHTYLSMKFNQFQNSTIDECEYPSMNFERFQTHFESKGFKTIVAFSKIGKIFTHSLALEHLNFEKKGNVNSYHFDFSNLDDSEMIEQSLINEIDDLFSCHPNYRLSSKDEPQRRIDNISQQFNKENGNEPFDCSSWITIFVKMNNDNDV